MKKLVVVLLALFLVACSDVPSGYVGIKINKLGSDKGVQNEVLPVGRYWLSWNESLYTFPTFAQTQVWTKDRMEGSPNDDSMTFQTVEGLNVNTDIGITYSLDPTKVSIIFQKYRKGVEEITNTVLRSMVRDALINAASTKPIESVYGSGKAELIKQVEEDVRKQCAVIGINIEHVYWIGGLRLPESIEESINNKAKASQMVSQRENEVAQSKAEADKLEQTARGEANSKLLLAEAEAKAIKIKGDALAANPKLVEFSAVEKWNGVLPQYMLGSSSPFIDLTKKN